MLLCSALTVLFPATFTLSADLYSNLEQYRSIFTRLLKFDDSNVHYMNRNTEDTVTCGFLTADQGERRLMLWVQDWGNNILVPKGYPPFGQHQES